MPGPRGTGKSDFSPKPWETVPLLKKARPEARVLHVRALSATVFPFVLAFWPMDRAILKEEDLLTFGFLTKDLRDFPKETGQAGRF